MAVYNRFRSSSANTTQVGDDDEDELRLIAEQKIAPKTVAAKPVARQIPSTLTPPVAAPPKAPTPVAKPVAAPAKQADTVAAEMRRKALGVLDAEDAKPVAPVATEPPKVGGQVKGGVRAVRNSGATTRSGFAAPDSGGGGIHVNGPGNHYDEDGAPQTTADVRISGEDRQRERGRTVRDVGTTPAERSDEFMRDREPNGGVAADDPRATPSVETKPNPLGDYMDGTDKGGGADDEDLSDVAAERLREQEAARAELAAGKAKALMMANARAQLAGMGLGGGTAALESDISRTQDRSAILAMSELQRRQRDEGRDDRSLDNSEKFADAASKRADADAEFTKIRRTIALNELERESRQDEDGDGLIAGKTKEYWEAFDRYDDRFNGDGTGGGESVAGPDGEAPMSFDERAADAVWDSGPIGQIINAWKMLTGNDVIDASSRPAGSEFRDRDDKYDYYTVGDRLYRVRR